MKKRFLRIFAMAMAMCVIWISVRFPAQAGDCQVCAGFPWKIVCIVEAAAFGVVILLILSLRKKRFIDNSDPD